MTKTSFIKGLDSVWTRPHIEPWLPPSGILQAGILCREGSQTWVCLMSSLRPSWHRVSTAAQITFRDKEKVFNQDIRSSGHREEETDGSHSMSSCDSRHLPHHSTTTYWLSCPLCLHSDVQPHRPPQTRCDSRSPRLFPLHWGQKNNAKLNYRSYSAQP